MSQKSGTTDFSSITQNFKLVRSKGPNSVQSLTVKNISRSRRIEEISARSEIDEFFSNRLNFAKKFVTQPSR